MTNNTLKQYARTLRLSGLLSTLELRLKEAEANRLPYQQFLESVFQDEINVREQRTIARRHKAADFREIRSLDNFDFAFNPPSIAHASTNWPPVILSASSATCSLSARPGWEKAISLKPSE
jgi:DNA replication protein DnaC